MCCQDEKCHQQISYRNLGTWELLRFVGFFSATLLLLRFSGSRNQGFMASVCQLPPCSRWQQQRQPSPPGVRQQRYCSGSPGIEGSWISAEPLWLFSYLSAIQDVELTAFPTASEGDGYLLWSWCHSLFSMLTFRWTEGVRTPGAEKQEQILAAGLCYLGLWAEWGRLHSVNWFRKSHQKSILQLFVEKGFFLFQ